MIFKNYFENQILFCFYLSYLIDLPQNWVSVLGVLDQLDLFILKQACTPSLNTQSCIKGLLGIRDFCFWAVLAAGPVLKKKVGGRLWATFEGVFVCLWGQKYIFYFFENTIASALKSCIIPFLQKIEKKNLTPNHEKTGFFQGCADSQIWMYYIKVS